MRIHLLDASKAHGVRCNNGRSLGSATADITKVTCVSCRPEARKSRYAGSRDDPNRVPPGPAGGD